MTMSAVSVNDSAVSVNDVSESPRTLLSRLRAVPWLTVLPLAVVMAYADGFWMVALRGTVGAIERTQEPFASWLRESALTLPVFALAVAGALTLGARRFGPVLRTWKTVVATGLMVVAAGTMVGIYAVGTSSAYDYQLQSGQLTVMGATHTLDNTTAGKSLALQQRASLGLQVRALGYGSAILLVTNLAVVGWVVAMRGGRLKVSTTRK
jgi:hypothetical protein